MDVQRFIWNVFLYGITNIIPYEGTRMECGVDLCSWEKKQMVCNQSLILMHNVTDLRTKLTNERAFLNLRRMCSGLPHCDSTNYCGRQRSVRVTYFCINENQVERQCPHHAQILSSAEGYIQSPGYPSVLSLKRCMWTIVVPSDSYVTITLHDFQHDAPEYAACNGGLRLTTEDTCLHGDFPSRDICQLRDQSATYTACGNVQINFLPGDRGYQMRFWLSYKVRKLSEMSTSTLSDDIPSQSEKCLAGHYDDVSSGDMVIAHSPGSNRPGYNNSVNNQTGLKSNTDRNVIINTDNTEKTVLYIAVTVAAVSLTGLVIVTAICIRQRRFKPTTQKTVISHNGMPHNSTSYNATARTRPLPPVVTTNGTVRAQDFPRLVDGYSVVADEIPYTPTEDTVRSPPYAEVEDHIVDRGQGQTFRFGRLSANKDKKSVENIYSELTDGKDNLNVYHEISDETFVHSPTISQNDQTQLIKDKRSSKTNPYLAKRCKRPISFEGPYASSDVTNNRRSLPKEVDNNKRSLSKELSGSLSYRSDSDGSLMMENENYEAYQSAHV